MSDTATAKIELSGYTLTPRERFNHILEAEALQTEYENRQKLQDPNADPIVVFTARGQQLQLRKNGNAWQLELDGQELIAFSGKNIDYNKALQHAGVALIQLLTMQR